MDVPTLVPMSSLAPMTLPPMPTIGPLPDFLTVPPAALAVVSSLAPVILPLVSTLAPEATRFATDSVNSAVDGASQAVSKGIKNATKAITAIKQGVTVATTRAPVSLPVASSQTLRVTDGEHKVKVPREHDGPSTMDTIKPFIIPVIGLVVGTAMMQIEGITMCGKLVLYFGAQSFMNIFMSWVLGTHVTIPAGTVLNDGSTLMNDLKGCPAGFALTALQQLVSFVLFMIYFISVYFTKHKYTPKELKTWFEWISVAIFGCVFAANIALNNFSLGYISIGVNLIIRSCLPLSTYVSQQGLSMLGLYQWKPCKPLEIFLMVVGVICATVFTWADFEGKIEMGGRFIGVIACLGSLLCGSLNLALAGVLGDTKLNVLDTCAYMAIPATLFLAPIIFFISKPVPGEWKHVGAESMTDWEVIKVTWVYSKSTILWLFLSGFFSFGYNIVQFTIVHTLSPSATAFGGNFNKAALTFMTLLLPFLQTKALPEMPFIAWEWIALLCNIGAFSFYSYLQIQAKKEAAALAHKQMDEKDVEEGSSDSMTESE